MLLSPLEPPESPRRVRLGSTASRRRSTSGATDGSDGGGARAFTFSSLGGLLPGPTPSTLAVIADERERAVTYAHEAPDAGSASQSVQPDESPGQADQQSPGGEESRVVAPTDVREKGAPISAYTLNPIEQPRRRHTHEPRIGSRLRMTSEEDVEAAAGAIDLARASASRPSRRHRHPLEAGSSSSRSSHRSRRALAAVKEGLGMLMDEDDDGM